MRVLHVDCGPEMRGGQWQVLQLVEGMRANGIEADLMCNASSPLLNRVSGSIPFSVSLLRSMWKSFDLTHVHDARSHTWAAVLGITPFIVSRRVSFAVRSGFASRWKYSKASRYLAISNAVAKSLIDAGVSAEKVRVVYDGVQEFPWKSDLSGKPIAPASVDPQKGSDLIAASGVPVQFSTDLPEDLRTASAFLYISRQEGLGSAIVMAMAAGVPVIASNVGGIPELVHHEETGLLVQNEPNEIFSAWKRLADEKELAAQMVENALVQVKSRFTAEIMVQRTLMAYEDLR